MSVKPWQLWPRKTPVPRKPDSSSGSRPFPPYVRPALRVQLKSRLAAAREREHEQKNAERSLGEINSMKQAASGHVVLGKGDFRLRNAKVATLALAAALAVGAPTGAYFAGKHTERVRVAEVEKHEAEQLQRQIKLFKQGKIGHATYWAKIKADLDKRTKYMPKSVRFSAEDFYLLEELCRKNKCGYPASNFNFLSEAFKVSYWARDKKYWDYENKDIEGAYNYLTSHWDGFMHYPSAMIKYDMLTNREKYDGLIRKLGQYAEYGVRPFNEEIVYHNASPH